MTLTETLIQQVEALSPEDQQKVLDFIESLQQTGPRNNPCGMYAHWGISIRAEDIDEARREAWSGFPRDLPEDESL